ncbi:MAG TPA: PHP domain-containing protein [Ktedonobacteraceae bacterium]|nr:PHP domain-containing protein [Ktedonobacteraceae bacterium]
MTRVTKDLVLSPDAPIDLHMHTTYSDGRWPAPQLIDYLINQGFALVAVTDHDRVDSVAGIQAIGAEKGLPILSGVEMSTEWRGKMGDVLCYGFDAENNELLPITQKVVRLQLENTHEVNAALRRQGYDFPRQAEILAASGGELRRPGDNMLLLREHGYATDRFSALQMIREAGYRSIKADMAETVDAAHRSGAVCLIAHPGRRESGFTFYSPELLDQVRAEVPIDGIEVYHPYHSQEMIEIYLAYAREHDLLLSTGSDSHSHAGRMPIKYRAEISRRLLERLGIVLTTSTSGTGQSS